VLMLGDNLRAKVYTKAIITNHKLSQTTKVFSKILVALDGSEASLDAAVYAIDIAKKYDAQLIALTVWRVTLHYYGLASHPDTLKQAKEKHTVEANQWFSEFSERAKENNIELKTDIIDTEMSIDAAIIEYAEHQGANLIVLGTRGKSGLKKLLLGSVAAGVVNYATCPVMVVK